MAKDLSASSFASYLKCQRCSFEVYYRSHAIRPGRRVFTARGEFLHGLSKLTKELRSYWFQTGHTHKTPIYHVLQFVPFCGVGAGMAKRFQWRGRNKCVGLFLLWAPLHPAFLRVRYGPALAPSACDLPDLQQEVPSATPRKGVTTPASTSPVNRACSC